MELMAWSLFYPDCGSDPVQVVTLTTVETVRASIWCVLQEQVPRLTRPAEVSRVWPSELTGIAAMSRLRLFI
ncbi:MAG: hypothetical protein ABIR23_04950 [Novosphingobium sp.]